MCWKSRSYCFVYLSFCLVLGFLGLFVYATAFHMYFLSFTGKAPLIFCLELIFCFETMSQSIFFISLIFSCHDISALATYLMIKYICIFYYVSRVFVCLRPFTGKASSVWNSWDVWEQTNDLLKTFFLSAKFLHRYFKMKLKVFLASHFVLFRH